MMVTTKPAVQSTRLLGPRSSYPRRKQRMFNKDLTQFMQSLSRILQSDRASEKRALLAGWRDLCVTSTKLSRCLCWICLLFVVIIVALPFFAARACHIIILCSQSKLKSCNNRELKQRRNLRRFLTNFWADRRYKKYDTWQYKYSSVKAY